MLATEHRQKILAGAIVGAQPDKAGCVLSGIRNRTFCQDCMTLEFVHYSLSP